MCQEISKTSPFFFYVIALGLLTATLQAQEEQEYAKVTKDTITIKSDTTEYEIIIIEVGFNAWMATNARPRGYYGQKFLEVRNMRYVTEWNARVLSGNTLYGFPIDYNPSIDYGYEVNYLLYNYFLFFEQKYNQRFSVTRGGRSRINR